MVLRCDKTWSYGLTHMVLLLMMAMTMSLIMIVLVTIIKRLDIILMTTMGIVMIIVMRVAMPTTTVGNIGVTMT